MGGKPYWLAGGGAGRPSSDDCTETLVLYIYNPFTVVTKEGQLKDDISNRVLNTVQTCEHEHYGHIRMITYRKDIFKNERKYMFVPNHDICM